MRGDSETGCISIRLADGEHYIVFRREDWGSKRLLLTPASENQDKADIEFYHHALGVSKPIRIGMIEFAKLPAGEVELLLEAEFTSEGTLSVAVRHEASERVENLKIQVPDFGAQRFMSGGGLRLRGGMRWFLGGLYVALGLAIALWLVQLITDWGEYESPPPPISNVMIDLAVV
ncbi:hypothetical protein S1OALGB6SA_2283 [Olavius algarvensis spirochete endosymbiont]|uniref:hypothetical protein n=1 Tax=Olavius algarvensis spirochete endosymbiont TaxID=260710 RepID=UPI000F2B769F|nr:hypothetical protein [Olavius algarvensis spirochete endosymbiont]VDB01182.1 hypothetical protein S1OALGB6SA_2283 [Olavius algarvensis spirochete endosymbiont]